MQSSFYPSPCLPVSEPTPDVVVDLFSASLGVRAFVWLHKLAGGNVT